MTTQQQQLPHQSVFTPYGHHNMLFTRYNLAILNYQCAMKWRCTIYGWMLIIPLVCMGCMGWSGYLLYEYRENTLQMEQNLQIVQDHILRNTNEMQSKGHALNKLLAQYSRITDLDTKLSVMLNMDEPVRLALPSRSALFDPVALPWLQCARMARRIHSTLGQLKREIHMEELLQHSLRANILNQETNLAHIPSIWPAQGRITSKFGYRPSPFTGSKEFHKGLDIRNAPNTPVIAPAAGKVIYSGVFSSYGIMVHLDHGNNIVTKYAHLKKSLVKLGQEVTRGQLIARMGNTGRSTAPHLHYEIHVRGKLTNPTNYILN